MSIKSTHYVRREEAIAIIQDKLDKGVSEKILKETLYVMSNMHSLASMRSIEDNIVEELYNDISNTTLGDMLDVMVNNIFYNFIILDDDTSEEQVYRSINRYNVPDELED